MCLPSFAFAFEDQPLIHRGPLQSIKKASCVFASLILLIESLSFHFHAGARKQRGVLVVLPCYSPQALCRGLDELELINCGLMMLVQFSLESSLNIKISWRSSCYVRIDTSCFSRLLLEVAPFV